MTGSCFADDGIPKLTWANVSYGPHKRNVLDVWQAKSDKPTPLAIYFHGGGFSVFDKSKIVKKWPATVKTLLDAKISVAAVNYRLIQHPVERQSTRLTCVATRDGQTSRDYQWWINHIPDYDKPHRDFHAMFGVKTREAFLNKMSDVSALSLITKDDPPIYMRYAMAPDAPVPVPTPSNPRAAISFQGHHVVFGLELKKKMDKLDIEANLDYPGSNSTYRSVEQFFVAKLKMPAFPRDPRLMR